MDKNKYLEDKDVSSFLAWLLRVAKDEKGFQIEHQYEIEKKGKGVTTTPWKCSGLFDAYEKYSWDFSYTDRIKNEKTSGSSFEESNASLKSLSNDISESIVGSDRDKCFNACLSLLDWGGVLGSVNSGNMQKILLMKPYICDYLEQVKKYFNSNELRLGKNHRISVADGLDMPIIMNSGFTKIYSLLCNDFIIYDSRVGAALGLLVRKYCEFENKNSVPILLNFHYGKAKTKRVNRDPSSKVHKFKSLTADMGVHINDNVKANWIVQKLLESDVGKFKEIENTSRALESALFMVGYRI